MRKKRKRKGGREEESDGTRKGKGKVKERARSKTRRVNERLIIVSEQETKQEIVSIRSEPEKGRV